MEHHGKLLERAVRRSGISLSDIARNLNISRRTLYCWFKQEKLSIELIAKVGKTIHYDFSPEFPQYNLSKIMNEASEDNYRDLMKNYIQLKEKYLELLKVYRNVTGH